MSRRTSGTASSFPPGCPELESFAPALSTEAERLEGLLPLTAELDREAGRSLAKLDLDLDASSIALIASSLCLCCATDEARSRGGPWLSTLLLLGRAVIGARAGLGGGASPGGRLSLLPL